VTSGPSRHAGPAPYRGPGPGRPAVPLPPDRMPLLRGGRLLKRWRYVGVYGPEVMLCAGSARIGPAWQVWWAVWDRAAGRLHERTRMARGRHAVRVEAPGRLWVRDGAVEIDLRLREGPAVEVVTPAGRAYAWTRKQGGVPALGRVRVEGRELTLAGRAVVDESAGYHDRRTSWRWSAGVGTAADGRALAWNLAEGIHDRPEASERTVWVDGVPAEVAPVRIAADLETIDFATGESLRCRPEAVRRRRDRLLVFSSDYEQPFGTFAGTLPGGIELAAGFGVTERHDVRW
jgi:hypothetical protein